MTTDQTRILLAINDNTAYSASDVTETMTLRELIDALEEATEDHGEDALVVLDNGQRYGARYGAVDQWRVVVRADEEDGDE